MTRNKLLRIKVTAQEKEFLKMAAGKSSLSNYLRTKIFKSAQNAGNNREITRTRFKPIPQINRHFYVHLWSISSKLERLGNWGQDLSERDLETIQEIRSKIAETRLQPLLFLPHAIQSLSA